MTYTIENEKIKVTISSRGAELSSLILKEDGTEYLWQADPTYWTGHAYDLFPICGRLTEGKYFYRGKLYEMNLHGFFRKTEIPMIEQTASKIVFRLTDDEVSLAQYPFHFEFTVTYTLDGGSVKTEFNVVNTDTKDLIFAVGGHPGFNVPLTDGETFEDYYLEFTDAAQPKKMIFSDTCYYTTATEDFPLEGGKILPLRHTLFDNDAIFLRDTAKEVTLKSKKSPKFVKVTFPGMKFLGFWHAPKTEAPYVCIEPWCSIPADDGLIDNFETKREMTHLAPGCTYRNSFNIEIG